MGRESLGVNIVMAPLQQLSSDNRWAPLNLQEQKIRMRVKCEVKFYVEKSFSLIP